MDTTLHIDYLTITTPHAAWGVTRSEGQDVMDYYEQCAFACLHEHPTFCHQSRVGVRETLSGMSGFKLRRFYPTFGWTLFGGASHGRICMQFPGEACHALRMDTGADGESIGLRGLMTEGRNRFTRIDIAGNWRTGASVDSVAASFKKIDLSQHPRYPSGTGLTQWISGLSGEQRGLVYRYFHPHPRADWIRIEFRLHGTSAENLRGEILQHGLLPPYKSLLAARGFDDEVMRNALGIGVESARIAYQKRQKAGSLKWLYGTALKSVKTAMETGILTFEDIVRYLGGTDD